MNTDNEHRQQFCTQITTSTFAGRIAPTVAIAVEARELPNWTMDEKFVHSPQPVPASPVDCGGCGPVKTLQLVPFGSTRLRIGMLPYTVSKDAGGR